MILVTIRMMIPLERCGEVLKTLKSIVGDTRIQPGCLSCRIYREESEEAIFMVEEVWNSQDTLDRYLRSEDGRFLLLVMEAACEPPEIKFQTISEPAGLEVVEKARGCKRNEDV